MTFSNLSKTSRPDENWAYVATGYAEDGRMIQIGWMSSIGTCHGHTPYQCGHTKPAVVPSRLTLAREVSYDPTRDQLMLNPLREYASLHAALLANLSSTTPLSPRPSFVVANGADASDLDVVFTLGTSGAGAVAEYVGARVLAADGGDPSITFNISIAATGKDGQRELKLSVVFEPPQHQPRPSVLSIASTESVDVRILVDRSSAEAFVLGGRWVFTAVSHWMDGGLGNRTAASGVALFGSVGTAASGTLHSMGCGWSSEPPKPKVTRKTIKTDDEEEGVRRGPPLGAS